MTNTKTRNRLDIMSELLDITKEMVDHSHDADFLIEAVDKRQALMDEYDAVAQQKGDPTSHEQQTQIRKLVKEVIRLDNTIAAALESHKKDAKSELVNSTKQSRILGYTNQAMSTSGSYMDFKK